MDLSPDQKNAVTRLEAGESLFLTGGAGTGKSETIRAFLERNPTRPIIRLASTGAAAQLIGGQTVHSFFRLPFSIHMPGPVEVSKKTLAVLRRTSTILIDEISMLRIDVFQAVVDRLMSARRGPGPFGGYQLVAVGDFAQLPPVMPWSEKQAVEHGYGRGALYAFQAKTWKDFGMAELTTVHRQAGDRPFAEWLGRLRLGEIPDLDMVNGRVREALPGAVKLVAINRMAQEINDREMAALPGDWATNEGRVSGAFSERDMRVPVQLALKPGARVILCANNMLAGYVNGSTGQLLELGRDEEGRTRARVRLDTGRVVSVTPFCWEASAYAPHAGAAGFSRIVTGTYTQLPILPGWAITIHRSQGMSIPRVHIDPTGIFEAGQAYVALSRATSLSGLTLATEVRPEDVLSDPRIRPMLSTRIRPTREDEPAPAP
ncbi:AAA family ATPase [Cereibacter sphaeroides]|uniref:ATP-dependent DNA helicase n=1 Tax=Cereibacter sphaeroides TaxID=1063 RepID=UPI001F444128|nr:DEAD/DEAH box helicase [Cereibacter sphaeroides]MCE6959633.1 AAA family ATPase [Cereibacter sphaeroides]MCE6974506.1 AAA family ATPase [Cereibacter sphaeroides]